MGREERGQMKTEREKDRVREKEEGAYARDIHNETQREKEKFVDYLTELTPSFYSPIFFLHQCLNRNLVNQRQDRSKSINHGEHRVPIKFISLRCSNALSLENKFIESSS